MTPRTSMVPQDPNGKIDWLAYVRTSWPVIVLAATMIFYLGGRLQSVDEKHRQNDLWERPWRQRIERTEQDVTEMSNALNQHRRIDGHAVMRAEYRLLLRRLEALEKKGKADVNY